MRWITIPETKFRFLGSQIRAARKRNNLTQQKLADQTGLAIKAVQETEKGKKNATYDTLSKLIQCLGISADTLFPTKSPIDNEKLQNLIRNVQMCDEKNQEVLLNTIGFLADQLLSEQEKAGSYQAQFEKWQNAQTADLIPLCRAKNFWNTKRIPANVCPARRKNLSPLCISPFIKQGRNPSRAELHPLLDF